MTLHINTIKTDLINRAKSLINQNLSDAYIESRLYSERDNNTGIRHILQAIKIAKTL